MNQPELIPTPPTQADLWQDQSMALSSISYLAEAFLAGAEHIYQILFLGKAANTDPDTYSWDGAMALQYKEEFLKAVQE